MSERKPAELHLDSGDEPDETARDPAADGTAPTFGAALEQLEQTLQRMEDEAIDIDDLAEELRNASRLLELCRSKLRKAEVEVREIVAGMAEPRD
jgi:exodeoxyribonuclease VII small subunit